jgi:membrane-associated phospholipid phosphatase
MPEPSKPSRSKSLARFVSNVLSPPAVFGLMGVVIALATAPLVPALWWGVLHGLLASLAPVAYIVISLRRGTITDLHMYRRQERHRPFLIGVSGALVAWGLLAAFGAPLAVRRLALFDAVLLSVLGLINVWWQISIHGAAIVGAVTISGVVFGLPVALYFSPLVLLVGWARLYLRRHTVRQVLAGALLGALVALLVFSTG